MKAIFIKRFWIAEILALGLAAFFVASGVGQMLVEEIEAQIGPQLEAAPRDPRTAARRPAGQRFVAVDGTPILDRNIFDSITGPIQRAGTAGPDDALLEGLDQGRFEGNEYIAVEPCGEKRYKVFTTVASSDPAGSFALLGSGKDQSYYNVGDTLGTQRIAGIGWRYVLLETGRGAGLCYLDLYGLEDTLYLPATSGEPAVAAEQPGAQREKTAPAAEELIEIGAGGPAVIDRRLFEHSLDELGPIIGSVQVVAATDDEESGEIDGFTVHGIRRKSLLHRLGVRNGDLIRRVAGIAIRDGASALAAYGIAAKGGRVVVDLERAGKTRQITFDIR